MIDMRTRLAVKCLRDLRYPLANIRRALPKLTGTSQTEISKHTGLSRATVGHHLEGIRRNPAAQKKISDIFKVPVKELFKNDGSPKK